MFGHELRQYGAESLAGIVVVFIAAEEGGEKNIGVDAVLKNGKLEEALRPSCAPRHWAPYEAAVPQRSATVHFTEAGQERPSILGRGLSSKEGAPQKAGRMSEP